MSGKRRGWNANLPTRWLTDPTIRDLSGDALATHVVGLIYGIEHENDGDIPAGGLRWLLPPNAAADAVIGELVTAGLWETTDTGYQIVAWSSTQTTRAEQERTRKQNRDRQSEYQKRQKEAAESRPDDPSRVSNALVTQPPEIRPDQASTNQASQEQTSIPKKTEVASPMEAVEVKVWNPAGQRVEKKLEFKASESTSPSSADASASEWATKIPGTDEWAVPESTDTWDQEPF